MRLRRGRVVVVGEGRGVLLCKRQERDRVEKVRELLRGEETDVEI